MNGYTFNIDHTSTKFVLDILSLNENKNSPRYYVELGSAHYKDGNNTYFLETEHGWKGLSIDIDELLVNEFNQLRKNPCILHDAQTFNYLKYFEENNFPKQIDFVQIDIEENYDLRGQNAKEENCLRALVALPLNQYRFSVITFEHNLINNFKNDWIRDTSRRILDSFGYALVVKLPHEDWWVDPNIVSFQDYKHFFELSSAYTE
jgi:hypothetical protein